MNVERRTYYVWHSLTAGEYATLKNGYERRKRGDAAESEPRVVGIDFALSSRGRERLWVTTQPGGMPHTYVLKTQATSEGVRVLQALRRVREENGLETCTPYFIGYDYVGPRAQPAVVMTDTGESLKAYMQRADAEPIDWAQLQTDIRCAVTALAAIGYVHDDLGYSVARNITTRDGRFFVIDFDDMRAVDDDFEPGAFTLSVINALHDYIAHSIAASEYRRRTWGPRTESMDVRLDRGTRDNERLAEFLGLAGKRPR
jgi:tRNA A-37 threonylcarbamoyl transferase component Bud32